MKRDPKDPNGEYEHNECCVQEGEMVYPNRLVESMWKAVEDEDHRVSQPSHYTHGEREAIDYMRDIGVLEQYCVGNIFKYLYRYKHKENPTEDLLKAKEYIDILVKELNDV